MATHHRNAYRKWINPTSVRWPTTTTMRQRLGALVLHHFDSLHGAEALLGMGEGGITKVVNGQRMLSSRTVDAIAKHVGDGRLMEGDLPGPGNEGWGPTQEWCACCGTFQFPYHDTIIENERGDQAELCEECWLICTGQLNANPRDIRHGAKYPPYEPAVVGRIAAGHAGAPSIWNRGQAGRRRAQEGARQAGLHAVDAA